MILKRLFLGLAAGAGLMLAIVPATTTPAEAGKRHWGGHHGKHWKGGKHWRHGNHWRGHRGRHYGWGPGLALGFAAPFVAAPYAYSYGPRCFWKHKKYGAKWVCR